MSTLFTQIIQKKIPAEIIAEDDQFIAFLDIMPLVEGHTLVVPKLAVDYFFDLDDDTLKSMMVFAKKVAAAVKQAIPCKRVGISVVGLEVPHAHMHVVPISSADDLNFTRPKLKPLPEELKNIGTRIRKFIGA